MGRQLELTPKQVQDIEEIWAAHRKLLLDLRVELDKQQEALQELLSKSSIDDKLLKDQINRVVETRGKLLEANMMRNNKIRKVLTPEQRAKLIELRKQKSPPPKPTPPSNK